MLKKILFVLLLLICGVYPATAQWEEIPRPVNVPSAMVFDTNRQMLIGFGGDIAYAWDGSEWHKHAKVPKSLWSDRRNWQSVVYAGNIKKALRFGGIRTHEIYDGWGETLYYVYEHFNETEVWDENAWDVLPIDGPSPRADVALGYDPRRQVVVLYGGFAFDNEHYYEMGDTWEFNGKKWLKVNESGPAPSRNGILIFNPHSKRMLLFDRNKARILWEWDGKKWHKVGKVPLGISIYWHSTHLILDKKHKQLLLFSGSGRALSPEVWRINPDYSYERLWFKEIPRLLSWRDITSNQENGEVYLLGTKHHVDEYHPSPRLYKLDPSTYTPPKQKLWSKIDSILEGPSGKCTLVYDNKNEVIMAFDGSSTWTLGDGAWTNHGATGPGRMGVISKGNQLEIDERSDYGMIYHPSHKAVLLIGGRSKNGLLNDEWLWDGSKWRLLEKTPGFPFRLSHFEVVYDKHNSRAVIEGNYVIYETNEWSHGTWVNKNKRWIQLKEQKQQPYTGPYEAWNQNMIYDSSRRKICYFESGNRFWEFLGRRWKEYEYQNPNLESGKGATIVFHPGLKRILIIGGFESFRGRRTYLRYYNEVRFWNGTYWEFLPSATLPTPRKFAGAAYNEKTGALILAGGIGPDGKPLQDTWRMVLPRKDR